MYSIASTIEYVIDGSVIKNTQTDLDETQLWDQFDDWEFEIASSFVLKLGSNSAGNKTGVCYRWQTDFSSLHCCVNYL